MTPVAPDFPGFVDAQARHRENFGIMVTFEIPSVKTWAPGTQLDPESGAPYDPFLEPATGATPRQELVRVNVISRPTGAGRGGLEGERNAGPLGSMDSSEMALILAVEDFARVEGAERVLVLDDTWEVEGIRHDMLGPTRRYIVYLEPA